MDFILRILWSPGIAMESLKRKKGGVTKRKGEGKKGTEIGKSREKTKGSLRNK